MNARPIQSATAILATVLLVGPMTAQPLGADERDDRIRSLEKRVEQLEELLKGRVVAQPASTNAPPRTTEAPKSAPMVSVGASGFVMRSADTNFALRIRGLVQADSRWYFNDGGISDNDTFLLRRARPILEGTVFRDFDFQFTPEFAGSSPAIRDAWLNYHVSEALELRAGKMKSPGSLERWQPVAATPMIERSMASGLWSVRDLGFLVQGELWPNEESTVTKQLAVNGLLHYALGVFNGTADGRAAGNSDFDDDKSLAGRIFLHPFLGTQSKPLQGLGLGVSATYGNVEGSNGLPDDRGYATEGQQTFFEYLSGDGTTPATADVIADGSHWRLGPQAYWYWGRLGLLGEYSLSSQRLRRDDGTTTFLRANHDAWMISASWLLTGEDATFRALTPRKNFDPRAGGWGAWQLVARYSQLDIDDDVFPAYADPTESATHADAWAVGLNWYLNRNVRTSLSFSHTDFKGGRNGSVAGQNEDALLTRFQVAF